MAELFIDCEEDFDVSPIEQNGLSGVESDCALSMELLFVEEEEIRSLNARTRGKDSVTDVLSFPNLDGIKGKKIEGEKFAFDRDDEGRVFLGSVVICRARAAQQAEEYGHSLRRELYYLAVHGLCHLLGYDHETDEEKQEMRAKEEEILTAMNITRDAE